MTSPYAWIIDQDHLHDEDDKANGYDSQVGVAGPGDADIPDDVTNRDDYTELKETLAKNYQHHHQFRMYDDDQILYVTGTLYWNGDPDSPDDDNDDYVYGPLRDYGMGGMGCVTVCYTGRKEWDCG